MQRATHALSLCSRSPLVQEGALILTADVVFWLLARSSSRQSFFRLSPEQRQLLASSTRAALYTYLTQRIGPHCVIAPFPSTSAAKSLVVISSAVLLNLLTGLSRLPLSSWPHLLHLTLSSPFSVPDGALYSTVLLPLGEELFFRRICARLSAISIPYLGKSKLCGILLTAALFTFSAHGFGQLGHAQRFFRNWYVTHT